MYTIHWLFFPLFSSLLKEVAKPGLTSFFIVPKLLIKDLNWHWRGYDLFFDYITLMNIKINPNFLMSLRSPSSFNFLFTPPISELGEKIYSCMIDTALKGCQKVKRLTDLDPVRNPNERLSSFYISLKRVRWRV